MTQQEAINPADAFHNVASFLEFLNKHFGAIVFHVPHASVELPEDFAQGLLSPYLQEGVITTELNVLNTKMSDVLLLDLIRGLPYPKVVAPNSRLYCDVERYWDDKKEAMAKYGMGAIYTKDYLGRPLKTVTEAYKRSVKPYYDGHHRLLQTTIEAQKGDVLIIDLHSFGSEMADVIAKGPYPDICIGYNEDWSKPAKRTVELAVNLFEESGYKVGINEPYSNSETPDCPFAYESMMLEVNKKAYMEDGTLRLRRRPEYRRGVHELMSCLLSELAS